MSDVTVGLAAPLPIKAPAGRAPGDKSAAGSFDDALSTAADGPLAAPDAPATPGKDKGGKGTPAPAAPAKGKVVDTTTTTAAGPVDVLALARAASGRPVATGDAPAAPDTADESAAADPGVATPPPIAPGAAPAVVAAAPKGPVLPAKAGAAAPVPAASGKTGSNPSAAPAGPDPAAADAKVAATAVPAPDPVAATAVAAQAGAQPASAMQQVVQALQALGLNATASSGTAAGRAAAKAVQGAAATPAASDGATALKAGGGVVTLDLDPEHLGRVSVTLSLRANAVDIRIEVEKAQTLALLDKDRHVLTAAVETAGRRADVDLTPALRSPSPDTAARPILATTSGEAAGDSRTLADSSPRQSRNQDDRPARAPLQDSMNDDDQVPTSRAVGRTDGGLYV